MPPCHPHLAGRGSCWSARRGSTAGRLSRSTSTAGGHAQRRRARADSCRAPLPGIAAGIAAAAPYTHRPCWQCRASSQTNRAAHGAGGAADGRRNAAGGGAVAAGQRAGGCYRRPPLGRWACPTAYAASHAAHQTLSGRQAQRAHARAAGTEKRPMPPGGERPPAKVHGMLAAGSLTRSALQRATTLPF